MEENKKSKILGIMSLLIALLGWIIYSKFGTISIVFFIITEVIALVLSIIALKNKNIKNGFALAGNIISIILLIIMVVIIVLGIVRNNMGGNALLKKAEEKMAEEAQNKNEEDNIKTLENLINSYKN